MALKLPPAIFTVLLFLMLLCFSFARPPVFSDPDTAWHLASGDLIRAHGLPIYDSWSFTTAGSPWYNLSWLFDVLASALYSATGMSGIYALTLFMFALALAWMASHAIRRGARPVAVIAVMPLTLSAIYVGILARPNMFSLLFTIAFYASLQRYRAGGNGKAIVLLPPLMALWVNMHGGFLLAFLLMAVFLFEAVVDFPASTPFSLYKWLNELEHHVRGNPKVRGYLMLLLACLLTSLINPYGFGVYYGASKSLFAWFDHTYVMEWKPIHIGYNMPFTAWFALVLCIGDFNDRRIALADRILVLALLLMALSSIRHAVICALLSLPFLSLRLTYLFNQSIVSDWLKSREAFILDHLRQPQMQVAGMVMVACALVLLAVPWLRDNSMAAPLEFPANRYPEDEAKYILDHYPKLRFLNHYDIGGYLVYIWRGKQKVFVDGRASSLYSEGLLRDYAEFIDNSGFSLRSKVVVNYYGIDGLIMPNDAGNAVNLQWNPDWKLVYRGPVAAIYLKASELAKPPKVKKKANYTYRN